MSYNLLGRARALAELSQRDLRGAAQLLAEAREAMQECDGIQKRLGIVKSQIYYVTLAEIADIERLSAQLSASTDELRTLHRKQAMRAAIDARALAESLALANPHPEPEVRLAMFQVDRVLAAA